MPTRTALYVTVRLVFNKFTWFLVIPNSMELLYRPHSKLDLKESWSILRADELRCLIPIFFQILAIAVYMINIRIVEAKAKLIIKNNFLSYWIELESRMLGKFCKWITNVICLIIIKICFIPLLMNRYCDRHLPLFRHLHLLQKKIICLWISNLQIYWYLIRTWWFVTS